MATSFTHVVANKANLAGYAEKFKVAAFAADLFERGTRMDAQLKRPGKTGNAGSGKRRIWQTG
jgi:hypothetical protein